MNMQSKNKIFVFTSLHLCRISHNSFWPYRRQTDKTIVANISVYKENRSYIDAEK